MKRIAYGLILTIIGLFETAYIVFVGVVPVPWAYALLTAPSLLLIGGLLLTFNLRARVGSTIAATGAGLVTLWAVGMIAWALFQTANKNPLVNLSDQMLFIGALIALTGAADWVVYQVVVSIGGWPRSR